MGRGDVINLDTWQIVAILVAVVVYYSYRSTRGRSNVSSDANYSSDVGLIDPAAEQAISDAPFPLRTKHHDTDPATGLEPDSTSTFFDGGVDTE